MWNWLWNMFKQFTLQDFCRRLSFLFLFLFFYLFFLFKPSFQFWVRFKCFYEFILDISGHGIPTALTVHFVPIFATQASAKVFFDCFERSNNFIFLFTCIKNFPEWFNVFVQDLPHCGWGNRTSHTVESHNIFCIVYHLFTFNLKIID